MKEGGRGEDSLFKWVCVFGLPAKHSEKENNVLFHITIYFALSFSKCIYDPFLMFFF